MKWREKFNPPSTASFTKTGVVSACPWLTKTSNTASTFLLAAVARQGPRMMNFHEVLAVAAPDATIGVSRVVAG